MEKLILEYIVSPALSSHLISLYHVHRSIERRLPTNHDPVVHLALQLDGGRRRDGLSRSKLSHNRRRRGVGGWSDPRRLRRIHSNSLLLLLLRWLLHVGSDLLLLLHRLQLPPDSHHARGSRILSLAALGLPLHRILPRAYLSPRLLRVQLLLLRLDLVLG